MLSASQILSFIKDGGIIHGISQTDIENIAKYPVYGQMLCIAEGTPSENGQNGKVEFLFDTKRESKPTILEDGSVDHKSIGGISVVRKGEPICKLIPPLPGKPGRTVYGYEIPAVNGKPAVLPRGKNTIPSSDGKILLSDIDGQVSYYEGRVNVYPTYEVPADVGNATGNVSFIGNVVVRGNVLSGFSIDAGGSVEVYGVVEGATIKAGGDIVLRRGMQGSDKGELFAGGDIIARYIEHSSVQAKNDIKSEAIMHSHVRCGNRLELSGRKGLLVGGVTKVGKFISAKVIGSPMATVTDVEIGTDPVIRERYKAARDELIRGESDIKKADQAIEILKKLEAANLLTPEKQELYAKSVRTKIHLQSRIKELKDEGATIETMLSGDAHAKISVSTMIYPGTKVSIGTCSLYVKENLQYCTLYREGADVRVGGYSGN